MKATTNPPAIAAYTEKDFHPATTVMQASPELVRGRFVSPAEALANLRPENDLIVEDLLHELVRLLSWRHFLIHHLPLPATESVEFVCHSRSVAAHLTLGRNSHAQSALLTQRMHPENMM